MRDQQVSADVVSGDKLLHKESMVVHMKGYAGTLWCGCKLSVNSRAWQQGDPDLTQLLICQQCDRAQP